MFKCGASYEISNSEQEFVIQDFGGFELEGETTGLNGCSVFDMKEAYLLP